MWRAVGVWKKHCQLRTWHQVNNRVGFGKRLTEVLASNNTVPNSTDRGLVYAFLFAQRYNVPLLG